MKYTQCFVREGAKVHFGPGKMDIVMISVIAPKLLNRMDRMVWLNWLWILGMALKGFDFFFGFYYENIQN